MAVQSKEFKLGDVVKCNPEHPQIAADKKDCGWRDAYHSFLKGTESTVIYAGDNVYDLKVGDTPHFCTVSCGTMLELLSIRIPGGPNRDDITPYDIDPPKKSTSALDKQVSGNHYKDCGIQPIEYIHANGLSYLEGNVIKYTTRHSKKNGKADIEKAIHYLELILEMEYKD